MEKQQKLTTRKRLYSSHSVQTRNWMYKSNSNNQNDKIHKYFDNNRLSTKKHVNHELFRRDNVHLKTTYQSPFANHSDIDYLKLINDQDQLEDKKLSWKIDRLVSLSYIMIVFFYTLNYELILARSPLETGGY